MSLTAPRPWQRVAPWLALLACAGVLGGMAIAIGLPTQTDFPWSASVLLDAGWRMLHGQVPHVDFHTPIGPAYLLVVGSAMHALGSGPGVLGVVATVFFVIACASGAMVAQSRLPAWAAAGAALAFGILALTPALFGSHGLDGITFGGHYTRCAWSVFAVFAVAAVVPRRAETSNRMRLAEAVLLGALVAIMATTKVTFAMASVGLLAVAQLWGDDRRSVRECLAFIFGMIAMATGILLAAGVPLAAYLADLGRSAASASTSQLVRAYLPQVDVIWLALLGTGAVVSGAGPWRAWHERWLAVRRMDGGQRWTTLAQFPPLPPFCLLIGATVGAGLLLSATNGIETTSPIVLPVAVIGLALALRCPEVLRRRFLVALAVALVVAWSVRSIMPMASILLRQGQPARATLPIGPYAGHEFLAAGGPVASDADLFENLSRLPNAQRTDLWWRYLHNGCRLLRSHAPADARVLNLDFINPFPYALGLPPLAGDHLYWHFQRNLTLANAPIPNELLDQTDFILVPKHPIFADALAAKQLLYQAWISQHASLVADNDWWWLYCTQPGHVAP